MKVVDYQPQLRPRVDRHDVVHGRRGSHNPRLQDLIANDLYYLVRMYRCQFGMTGPRAPTALREHGHILEAIAERDGELAEILMRRHIRASRQQAERRLRGEPPAAATLAH